MSRNSEIDSTPVRDAAEASPSLSLLALTAAERGVPVAQNNNDKQRRDDHLPALEIVANNNPLPTGEAVRRAHNDEYSSIKNPEGENKLPPHLQPAATAAREVAGIIRGTSGMLDADQMGRIQKTLQPHLDNALGQRDDVNFFLGAYLNGTPYRAQFSGGDRDLNLTFSHREGAANPANPSAETWRNFHQMQHRAEQRP